MTLRPTPLLPPKRLSTPRSARRVSPTDWGLLPGARAPTRAGLAPAGLVQLSGRTTVAVYGAQIPKRRLSAMLLKTSSAAAKTSTDATKLTR